LEFLPKLSLATRIVEPEILDSLPADDPAALANRRDLRLYNRLMGTYGWFSRTLQRVIPITHVTEYGAGDGSLAFHLLRSGIINTETIYAGVDWTAQPENWPYQWHGQDIREFIPDAASDVLIANLILHQFTDPELKQIGERIQNSSIRYIITNEPTRKRHHLWQVSLSRMLRIHPVTYHDARVSIRAGFRRSELASLLRLAEPDWNIKWSETFMGCNRLVCIRK
jgi:hypothetical protein